MPRAVFRIIALLLIVWIVATVVSPAYDLPNTVLRAGKFAPAVALDFLLTVALLLCCLLINGIATGFGVVSGFSTIRKLACACVLLC